MESNSFYAHAHALRALAQEEMYFRQVGPILLEPAHLTRPEDVASAVRCPLESGESRVSGQAIGEDGGLVTLRVRARV